MDGRYGTWDVSVLAQHDCRKGVRAEIDASRVDSGGRDAGGGRLGPGSLPAPAPNSFLSIPIFCRRDDYMFLPPNALAGIPCVSINEDQNLDPHQLALQMEAAIAPPELHIRMNPQKGMVNVPTWFWIEGYDGGTLSDSQVVLVQHKICHLVADRGPDGLAVLDGDGRPHTHPDCHTDKTTFDVGVRLWPSSFNWDFGDKNAQDVPCAGTPDCPNGLGLIFVDALHPSSIQHPYSMSSLGTGLDTYTVTLGITFEAQYRVSINGQDQGGWHALPSRGLTWSATHQVQEAQAVLTAPGLPAN